MAQLGFTFEELGLTPPKDDGDSFMREIDQDEDSPIRHTNEAQSWDGSTYKEVPREFAPGLVGNSEEETQKNLDAQGLSPLEGLMNAKRERDAVNEYNQELYQNTGKPLTIFGMETPIRYNEITDDEGDPATEFVPPPQIDGPTRVIGGAGLQAVKGVAGTGEYIMDQITSLAEHVTGLELGDNETNWVDQNFLTLPPQNEWEAMGQEIGSMIIGGVTGGALLQAVAKAGPVASGMSKLINNFHGKALTMDVANVAATKTQMFAKMLGEIIGATVTTPKATDSLSGGFVPDGFLGMGEAEQNKLGHVVDNTLFGVGAAVAGKVLAPAGDAIKGMLGMGKPAGTASQRADNFLFEFTKQIDPHLSSGVEVSDEETYKRMQILAEAINNNKVFEVPSGKHTVNQNAVNAIAKASEEYVTKAYGYLRNQMSPDEWKTFVGDTAVSMENSIAMMRGNMRHDPLIQASDAEMAKQGQQFMRNEANALASPDMITAAGQSIADPAVSRLNAAQGNVTQAGLDRAAEEARLGLVQTGIKNELSQKAGDLGNNVRLQDQVTNVASDLMAETKNSVERVRQAFNSIPESVGYDKNLMADMIIQLGNRAGHAEQIGMNGGQRLFPTPPTDPTELAKYRADLIAGFPDDLKDLFNNKRPAMSNILDKGYGPTGDPLTDYTPAEDVRNFIDIMAETSNNPSFKKAMETFTTEVDKFSTNALESLRNKIQYSNLDKPREWQETLLLSRQILTNSFEEDSGLALNSVMGLLDNVSDTKRTQVANMLADISQAQVAAAINNGADVTSGTIAGAMTRYANAITRLDPAVARNYQGMIDNLRNTEAGLNTSEEALKQAELDLANSRKEVNSSVAADFIAQNIDQTFRAGGEGQVSQAFNNLFRSEEKTTNLMQTIASQGSDPDVLAGVQSQYLRYLTDTISGTKPISGIGEDAVTDVKATPLFKMLNGSDRTGMSVMKQVLESKPELLGDLTAFLEEMGFDAQARMLRPQVFGSNTAIDTTNRKLFNTMITLTFGQLSRPGATLRNLVSNFTGAQKEAYNAEATEFLRKVLVNADALQQELKNTANSKLDEIETAKALLAVIGVTPTATGKSVFQDVDEDVQTKEAFGLENGEGTDDNGGPLKITVDGAGSYDGDQSSIDSEERIQTAQVDDTTYMQMEDLLSRWAQGKITASEVQKNFPSGYKPNLRGKYGNDVDIMPINGGSHFKVYI